MVSPLGSASFFSYSVETAAALTGFFSALIRFEHAQMKGNTYRMVYIYVRICRVPGL